VLDASKIPGGIVPPIRGSVPIFATTPIPVANVLYCDPSQFPHSAPDRNSLPNLPPSSDFSAIRFYRILTQPCPEQRVLQFESSLRVPFLPLHLTNVIEMRFFLYSSVLLFLLEVPSLGQCYEPASVHPAPAKNSFSFSRVWIWACPFLSPFSEVFHLRPTAALAPALSPAIFCACPHTCQVELPCSFNSASSPFAGPFFFFLKPR